MDTFMDKLAQKLNAQEMIKANNSAEAAEAEQLKEKVKEYEACLDKMKAIMEGEFKMPAPNPSEDEEKNAKLLEEIRKLIEELGEKLEKEDTSEGKITELSEQLGTESAQIQDEIHKECVKVYRNVQAVVEEQNEKQKEELSTVIATQGKKVSGVKAMVILTFILSLASAAGIAFQILEYFKLLPF